MDYTIRFWVINVAMNKTFAHNLERPTNGEAFGSSDDGGVRLLPETFAAVMERVLQATKDGKPRYMETVHSNRHIFDEAEMHRRHHVTHGDTEEEDDEAEEERIRIDSLQRVHARASVHATNNRHFEDKAKLKLEGSRGPA